MESKVFYFSYGERLYPCISIYFALIWLGWKQGICDISSLFVTYAVVLTRVLHDYLLSDESQKRVAVANNKFKPWVGPLF